MTNHDWLRRTDPHHPDTSGTRAKAQAEIIAVVEKTPRALMDKDGVPMVGLFDPGQARVPAGSPGGGQWTAGLGGLIPQMLAPDGGFTYSPTQRSSPKTGFALSVYPERGIMLNVKDLTLKDLAKFAVKNRDLLEKPGHYMGGWHNPSDGKLYLDVSIITQSKDDAFKLSTQFKQLAFFDLGTGKSVFVTDGAETKAKE